MRPLTVFPRVSSVSVCREVLSVARRLLRERGELHAALQQLRDDWQLLHERLLRQLQLAAAERRQLREQLRDADQLTGDEEDDDQLSAEKEQLAGELSELLDRWQHCGSQAAEVQFVESQARLQAAETLWHRLRGARKEPAQPLTDAQEIVRWETVSVFLYFCIFIDCCETVWASARPAPPPISRTMK